MREGKALKKLSLLAILILLLFSLSGCSNNGIVNADSQNSNDNVCLNIYTTNKVLYYAVKDIVKDKHYVRFMFNSEDEQTNFVYSQDSLNNIAKQDLFIYMGADAEPWISSFTNQLNKSKVCFVNASTGVSLLQLANPIKIKDYQIKNNPYYYMNVDNYKIMLLNIKIAVEEKDPQNRSFYESNYAICVKEIDKLQKQAKEIKAKSKDCTFLVDDYEFDYFMDYCKMDYYVLPVKGLNDTGDYAKQLKELESKISEAKKVYYLYDNENNLKNNKSFLLKNKVDTIEIEPIDNKYNTIKLLQLNISIINDRMK